jgi:mannan endo-1,6-alpha-mannosidase
MEGFSGHDGTACGFSWLKDVFGYFDGKVGVGEQMNALDALMYNLVEGAKPPYTAGTGGRSGGNVGGGASDDSKLPSLRDITTGDKIGASILTSVLVALLIAFSAFLII